MPVVVYKATTMFQLTTIATNPAFAVPHTGGWSESWWSLTDPYSVAAPALRLMQQRRAALLPAQASIIGYRVQKYNLNGNHLEPLGSQALKITFPGRAGIIT